MKNALLIIAIILLIVYAYIMISSMIYVKKNEGVRIELIRDKLLKRINISTIIAVILFVIILLRILVFK